MSFIRTSTPGSPLSSLDISLWKISDADEIPLGSCRKENLSNGLMKVVNFLLWGTRGICQNPLDASKEENIVDPTKFGAMSPRGWQYVAFSSHCFIQLLEINTDSDFSRWLQHWTRWRTPVSRLCDFLNNVIVQHPLQLCFHFRQEWEGNSSLDLSHCMVPR